MIGHIIDWEAKWQKVKQVEWDGVTPVFQFDGDEFFRSSDEIEEYMEEHGIHDMRLLIGYHNIPNFDPCSVIEDYTVAPFDTITNVGMIHIIGTTKLYKAIATMDTGYMRYPRIEEDVPYEGIINGVNILWYKA